jgi:hypothetical protein
MSRHPGTAADPLPPPGTVYGRRTPNGAVTAAEALHSRPQSRLEAWRQQQAETIHNRCGSCRRYCALISHMHCKNCRGNWHTWCSLVSDMLPAASTMLIWQGWMFVAPWDDTDVSHVRSTQQRLLGRGPLPRSDATSLAPGGSGASAVDASTRPAAEAAAADVAVPPPPTVAQQRRSRQLADGRGVREALAPHSHCEANRLSDQGALVHLDVGGRQCNEHL